MALVLENLLGGDKHQIGITRLDKNGDIEFNVIKTNVETRNVETMTFTLDINDLDELILYLKNEYTDNEIDWPI